MLAGILGQASPAGLLRAAGKLLACRWGKLIRVRKRLFQVRLDMVRRQVQPAKEIVARGYGELLSAKPDEPAGRLLPDLVRHLPLHPISPIGSPGDRAGSAHPLPARKLFAEHLCESAIRLPGHENVNPSLDGLDRLLGGGRQGDYRVPGNGMPPPLL